MKLKIILIVLMAMSACTHSPIKPTLEKCDPIGQPSPHWGMKDGECLRSCGTLGGNASSDQPCDPQQGWFNVDGPAYDVKYCCRIMPTPSPTPTQEPWKTVTREQIDAFKCDLGGMRVSRRLGPKNRPHAPSDYVFTPTYASYGPEERAEMREAVKARGYTHFPIGPIWERGYPGWTGHDYLNRPEEFANLLRELWRDGLIPVLWLMPDGPFNMNAGEWGRSHNPINWAEVERVLTPIYQRKDFQELARVVVFGWEVTDNEWVKTIDKAVKATSWMARVFPNAETWWHAATNNGAPCNYEIDGEGCEGKAWRAMAPYLTGHFFQDASFGGWHMDGLDSTDPAARKSAFIDNLKYDVMRFQTSHYSSGGVLNKHGEKLKTVAGEYSAYFELNDRDPESLAIEYGRAAMSVPGVSGFCDGGPAN